MIDTNLPNPEEREHGESPEAEARAARATQAPQAQTAVGELQASNENSDERESADEQGGAGEFQAHVGPEGAGASLEVKAPGSAEQQTGAHDEAQPSSAEPRRTAVAEGSQHDGKTPGPGNVHMRVDPQRGTGVMSWNANPFAIMRTWTEQIDRLFDEFMRTMNVWPAAASAPNLWGTLNVPHVRTQRRNGTIEVVADLPGVDRNALEASLDENVLTIAGERYDEEEKAEGGRARTMQRYGRFERTVMLPSEIDASRAQATLKNGVLRVSLPISQQAPGKRIEVRAK